MKQRTMDKYQGAIVFGFCDTRFGAICVESRLVEMACIDSHRAQIVNTCGRHNGIHGDDVSILAPWYLNLLLFALERCWS